MRARTSLAKVESYEHLLKIAEDARIGRDLVIQTAVRRLGPHHVLHLERGRVDASTPTRSSQEPEVKIMKRINCRGSALEACVTRCGTIVGPLMTELVGFKELTPYKGGWCGNEIFPGAFSEGVRDKARDLTFKFGKQLKKEGYRGYFELDFLIDDGRRRGLSRRAEPAHHAAPAR